MKRFALVLGLLLVCLAACSTSKERAEAVRLLDAVEAIRVDDTTDVRRPRVATLKRLALTTSELGQLRDACARAHETLLSAEDAQVQARELIAAATRDPSVLTAAHQNKIQATLDRSTRGVEASRTLFEACNAPIEQLSRRIRGAH